MDNAAEAAPAWFYVLAFGLFPASFVVLWILSHMPNSSLAEAVFRRPFALPITAGFVSAGLLLYGAKTYA